MTMTFSCERCGHRFEVDESLAGKSGRCKQCGHEMRVPSPEFRLAPIAEEAVSLPEPADPLAIDDRQEESIRPSHEHIVTLAPIEEVSEPGNIPEEFLADRAPYELDVKFEPAPSAVSPQASPTLMRARSGWRHQVGKLLAKLGALEEWVYLALMLFWLIAAIALLFELKPLGWTMLGLVVVCSLILLVLGGFEIVVKPFRESPLHGLAVLFVPFYVFYYVATRWQEMRTPFRKAVGALGPLIVLVVLALFTRPIRDWFLHPPPKKDELQGSYAPPASSPSMPRTDLALSPAPFPRERHHEL
jgi:hypothetical protein